MTRAGSFQFPAGSFSASPQSPYKQIAGKLRRQIWDPKLTAYTLHLSDVGISDPHSQFQQLQRMNSLNRLAQGHGDEPSRIGSIFDNEAKERRKAEIKVLELTAQLEDARRGICSIKCNEHHTYTP